MHFEARPDEPAIIGFEPVGCLVGRDYRQIARRMVPALEDNAHAAYLAGPAAIVDPAT